MCWSSGIGKMKDRKKKKILFYVHSLNKGGAERVIVTLADYLKKNYEITILTDVIDKMEYALPDGIERVVIGECKGKFGLGRVRRLLRIRSYCKTIAPDLCIGFMISCALRLISANRFRNIPIIVSVRSNPNYEYSKPAQIANINKNFALTSKVICQTEYQKECFDEKVQSIATVIKNPISAEFGKLEAVNSKKKIVSVGRLYDYKNHKMLIQAFAQFEKKYSDYELVIYGEGPYRNELENEIEKVSLKNKIFLAGESNHVAQDIIDAEIFVLSSNTEGMPNALMEAMAIGLACISTDCPCGGPRSLIRHGKNGLLCEMNNVEQLAAYMEELTQNKDYRKMLGENAKKITEECSIETIASQWEHVIQEVLCEEKTD